MCTSVCGTTCDALHSSGATCGTGKCVYASCASGYANCDTSGTDTNGCETATNAPATAAVAPTSARSPTRRPLACSSGTTCTYTCSAGFGDCVNARSQPQRLRDPAQHARQLRRLRHRVRGHLGLQQQRVCAAPAPTFGAKWGDPTGWRDSANKPIQMTLLPAINGIVYMCRTYWNPPSGSVPGNHVPQPPTPPAFTPCDGGTGTANIYKPQPLASLGPDDQAGTYRPNTSTRAPTARTRARPSPTTTTFITASTAWPRATPPRIADTTLLRGRRWEFTTTVVFPTDGTVKLRNPFIEIPFGGTAGMVQRSSGMSNSGNYPFWQTALPESLRHQGLFTAPPLRRERGEQHDHSAAHLRQPGVERLHGSHRVGIQLGQSPSSRSTSTSATPSSSIDAVRWSASSGGAPTVTDFSVSGWQKLQTKALEDPLNTRHQMPGVATCNDNDFTAYLPPERAGSR